MIDIDKAWETAKERPADAIGIAVTLCFVVASTIVGLVFAWDESQSMPRPLTAAMLAAILGGELYKALYFPLTWKRGRWFYALLGLPILAVCIAYSLTANNKTMERYFGKHEFATVIETAGYKTAKADVARIEERYTDPVKRARPAGTVRADLAGEQSTLGIGDCSKMYSEIQRTKCPIISGLKAELANAEERDKLDAQLAIARAKLDAYEGQAPKASASLGPITPAFAALGLIVTTPQEALAAVFIALTELGSLFGGAVFVSGAGFARRQPAPSIYVPQGLQENAQPLLSSSIDHGDDRVNQVRAFFETGCEQRSGAVLKQTDAWKAFNVWCQNAKQPRLVNEQHFKMIASHRLSVPKKLMTHNGERGMHYLNLTLKTARTGVMGNVVQLTRLAAAGHA
jgi:hypothetical protein